MLGIIIIFVIEPSNHKLIDVLIDGGTAASCVILISISRYFNNCDYVICIYYY